MSCARPRRSCSTWAPPGPPKRIPEAAAEQGASTVGEAGLRVTVRVDLVDAKPPVWRRLELPSTLRLDQLHGVLQAVFDWTDSHLHRFVLDDDAWGDGEKYLCPYDVEEGEDDGVPEGDVRLDEVLAAPGDVLTYVYDYGDNWHHRLVVEQVGPSGRGRTAAGRARGRAAGGQRRHLGLGRRSGAAVRPGRGAGSPTPCGAPPGRCRRSCAPCSGTSTARRTRRCCSELLAAAGLDTESVVDDDIAETATARYRWLLARVGAGVRLTSAGFLPPALVTEAMDALWPEDRWIGKRNREDLTPHVSRLRASAQRTGLLRVSRGQLLVTKAGAALRDDPHGLFLHLAERLNGRPRDAFARTCIPLVLVAVAAGRSHRRPVADLLTAAGWTGRGGTDVHRYAVTSAAGHVDEVLDLDGRLRRT